MPNREQINEIDHQINGLRYELIKIIAQINFAIGSDRRAILSSRYKDLKAEYYNKKEEIHMLREMKDSILTKLSYLRV